MQGVWQRRRILIWGKTRPEVSRTYRETVCTGGVFADNKRLVRIYPIPLRYMDDEQVFKKYQWIEADVMKSSSDARPESYKIRADTIKVEGEIGTDNGTWQERARWVMAPTNVFASVEALQTKQREDGTSLGLIRPKTIIGFQSHKTPDDEKRDFQLRYEEVIRQQELPIDPDTGREIKPLRAPDYRFRVRFRCDDETCQSDHIFGILDWEIDALYFGCIRRGGPPQIACQKVIDKLQDTIGNPKNDACFYLGNISNHPRVFTVVGLWYPKKQEAVQSTFLD